jgi:hypothetical protein
LTIGNITLGNNTQSSVLKFIRLSARQSTAPSKFRGTQIRLNIDFIKATKEKYKEISQPVQACIFSVYNTTTRQELVL